MKETKFKEVQVRNFIKKYEQLKFDDISKMDVLKLSTSVEKLDKMIESEINDNLLLQNDSSSRVSYLKRVRYQIIETFDHLKNIESGSDELFDKVMGGGGSVNDRTQIINHTFYWHAKKCSELIDKLLMIEVPLIDEGAEIDLSNSKTVEKIIGLIETGMLDDLRKKRPFNTSISSLASFLSLITGVSTKTLQPCLNAYYNKNSGQKNNPTNNKKTVAKVRNQLIALGFPCK